MPAVEEKKKSVPCGSVVGRFLCIFFAKQGEKER
jgi:hypothetical protein